MLEKIWYEVKGYEGLYEINRKGDIRSLNKGHLYRVMDQRIDRAGYYTVRLSKKGKGSTQYVHRLLGFAFIENHDNKPFINHKDCDKLNNSLDNLEWVTHSENMLHAYAHKRLNSSGALPHYNGKAIVCVLDGQHFLTVKEAAEVKGINYNTLRNTLNLGVNKDFIKVGGYN